jgi:mono/diheme cytochrome c family protein
LALATLAAAVALSLALASCKSEPATHPTASAPTTVAPSTDKPAEVAARNAEFARIVQPFVEKNCLECHDAQGHEANLNLQAYTDASGVVKDRARWELIFNRLRHGEMPPATQPQPDPDELKAVTHWLAGEFDRQDQLAPPYVGQVAPRRLNRTEYNNTVRDLLGVNFQPADDFPPDDSGYGFDNNGDVLSTSPMLTEKYLKAAEKVARTAVFGVEKLSPTSYTHQPWYIDFDTTKEVKTVYDETGLSLPYALHVTQQFPVEGDYDLTAILRGFMPVGADPAHLGFWVDGKLIHEGYVTELYDGEMNGLSDKFRAHLTAGEHWLAISFIKIYEGLPLAYGGPHPNQGTQRIGKSPTEHFVSNLVVTGPFNQVLGPTAESLQKLYGGNPPEGKPDDARARQIVADLAHRAYRRPVTDQEVDELVGFVNQVERDGDSFEEGLCVAIERMLISPNFLFRLETDPPPGLARAVDAHELATRLSYFLWSSLPDAELLRSADDGQLTEPAVLEAQVRRMIQDPKSFALVENFGGQWLQFRALESHSLERKNFQQYTDYTRMSMQQETENFFAYIMREDRSVLDFIDANYSFLNQRMAEYYGIPGVEGAEFRKVDLPPESHRQGVITQASVLTVSSYANRTSPVIRGKWVLENILNAAPPPPPPNVPSLKEEEIGVSTTMRQQLEAHRANPICASCHARMDPLGFGLENFDAVGAWRDNDGKFPIDASGTLPDGRTFNGPTELTAILMVDKDAFAECISDKLLTYALGRGLTPADQSTVRHIAAQLAANDYHFSSLVLGVVNSPPFLLRAKAEPKP